MTKKELTDKVGKRFFLANDYTLAAKLNYESGIREFDNYLDGKTLKQIHAVIHLTKYPKGLVIRIAKNFSSFPFGLPYNDIEQVMLSEKTEISKLVFETINNGKIIFSLKTDNLFDVKEFLDDISMKYTFEKSTANRQITTENKTVYNSKQRKK
jgi:hypothetical protein